MQSSAGSGPAAGLLRRGTCPRKGTCPRLPPGTTRTGAAAQRILDLPPRWPWEGREMTRPASAERQAGEQLSSQLALSAAALLLLALAFRHCRRRRGRGRGDAEPRGKAPRDEASAGKAPPGPRRRRVGPTRDEEEEGGRHERLSETHVLAPAVGSEPGSPSAAEQGMDTHETPCASARLETGLLVACPGRPGRAPSAEEDLAVHQQPGQARGEATHYLGAALRTRSVTSELGLTTHTRGAGTDTAHSFCSVAKIQVEESYISKTGAGPAVPRLKGRVYDYYVQSTSQSVSTRSSQPYIPRGITVLPRAEQVPPEQRGSETRSSVQQSHAAAVHAGTWDCGRAALPLTSRAASPILPPPMESSAASQREGAGTGPGPSLGSILDNAETPGLLVPIDGVEVVQSPEHAAPRPQPELVASDSFSQMPPASGPSPDIHLGNCYEVLCMAKAQRLGHLQEAAYKVMSDNYLQVLGNPSIYGRLSAREQELILRRRMEGRERVVVADVSTDEAGPHAGRLCYYNEAGDCWHELCQVPPEVASRGAAACAMFNYLLVVVGCSRRVFCYDPLTGAWRELCPLQQARPRCRLVALDGCLYAIGGEGRATVERYEPQHDRWAFAAPLPGGTFAVAHMATVCDGEIYVSRGSVLLRYAAHSDSWRAGPAGGSNSATEMVAADGFIYRFELGRAAGITVYRCSARARLWYACAAHAGPGPSCLRCVAVGRLVHCLGRHVHLRFLADTMAPRFGARPLRPFPEPHGSLLPAVLALPKPPTARAHV